MSNNIGIITEQGFPVSGSNLGFQPLTESEKEAIGKELEKEESTKKEK